jgi:hypothetical protein
VVDLAPNFADRFEPARREDRLAVMVAVPGYTNLWSKN